ncbi:MAG: hypothetical protein IJ994_04640 [Firmicutes bacterium]|nr:hypothetical protein [Bacillota bacterium]
MKRYAKLAMTITALMLCIGCLVGCGKSDEEIQTNFSKILSSKATPQTMEEAEDFAETYAKKLTKDGASVMVAQLEDYLIQYINTDRDDVQVQSLAAYFEKESGSLDENKIQDHVTKEFYQALQNVHIYPVYFEDKVQLRVNYATLNETFAKVIDPALSELYEIDQMITDEPATQNATIQISYDELMDRAMAVEELIVKYPDNIWINDEVRWLYSTYLDLIMMGTTNTPVFDYQTGDFNSQAKVAYEHVVNEHQDTTLAWALCEYFAYLEEIEYTMNYKDSMKSKLFFDTCYGIRIAAEKRVFEQNVQ